MKQKLLLIDGNSVAFRAFYALTLLHNRKGIHTNAIYGFATMLNKILQEEQPTHALVAFDAGKTTFRHEFYQEYKGGRQKTPPELSEQLPFIRELVQANGLYSYELDNYEADDIIGTLATKAAAQGFEVKVISGDRDLTQLATEQITIGITKKGITEVEMYTPATVREKYNLTPIQIIDLKGLMGDASDNIPGVPGVGEKTALKLLQEFGSVETVLDSIDKISGKKLVENLTEFRDQAILSKKLAAINLETPLTVSFEEIQYAGPEIEQLRALYKELEFKSFLDKMEAETFQAEEKFDDFAFQVVKEITPEMLNDDSALYVEVLDENYFQGDVLGIGLANRNGTYFIPTEVASRSELFQAWLSDATKKKVVYDAKESIVALNKYGLTPTGIRFDACLAAYLINPSANRDDLAAIASQYEVPQLPSDETFYGKGAKRAIPELRVLAEHIAQNAYVLWKLVDPMEKVLNDNEQLALLVDLELPTALVLAKMELTGVRVDRERLQTMGRDFASRLVELELNIYMLAGEHFNINSTKQLGVILFEKLGLPVWKKTKTGYSTSAEVLEALEDKHPIIKEILTYRQLSKLQSTYVEGLQQSIYQDGKIHTSFNQALTATGRLSSIHPNLQNIPIRLEEGRRIRQAFIPSEPGWIIFAADYSQIELRVLAHIANDANMIEAFKQDMDIHTKTAMDVFGVRKEEVTSNMRRNAKAVNFGIVYGISDYGLSQNIGISRKEAKDFIDKYLDSFPGVQAFMKDIVLETKKKGYVTTLLNRRRYIPEINSSQFNLRSFAERTALNTPIQGSAADIIKLAMIRMDARLKREGLQARMLLQVHDELIFEAPEEEVEALKRIVPEEMSQAIQLRVPLKADFAYGPTWYDAK